MVLRFGFGVGVWFYFDFDLAKSQKPLFHKNAPEFYPGAGMLRFGWPKANGQ
jgi:hypothetical protein